MKAMRIIKSVLICSALALTLVGCETLESMSPASSPRIIDLNGTSYSEEEYGSFESWVCRDYVHGGKVLVEVGIFENPDLSDYGFILYDGSSSGDITLYQRKGVNRRWDWETTGGSFSFVLKPDGTGLFYDFSNVDEGEMTKANDIYKCSKR